MFVLLCRLTDELQNQQEMNSQIRQQASTTLSAPHELQARTEVSDSHHSTLCSDGMSKRTMFMMLCRLADELESQQDMNSQFKQQASAALSALDELQARKEVSDSSRGRLRSILAGHQPAPAVATSTAGHFQEEEVRHVPSIRQSSRCVLGGSIGILHQVAWCSLLPYHRNGDASFACMYSIGVSKSM